jgi:hypothetical protein
MVTRRARRVTAFGGADRPPAGSGSAATTTATQALLLGVIALSLSLLTTRACAIWDRQWHVPLRAQDSRRPADIEVSSPRELPQ